MNTLKVGDTVLWRGGFGERAPVPAVVESLENCEPGEKYGELVASMDWEIVPQRAVVTLTNGYWAYGEQLSPKGAKDNEH